MYYENEKLYAVPIGEVIVNECLDRNLSINTSKLMKLLYYMQKLHLQKYNDTMFNDEIRVTANGPHIDRVDNYFINGRLGFKEKLERRIILMDSHKDVANGVLEKYGKLTPTELMKLSQEDELFKAIWAGGKGKDMVIPFAAFTYDKESQKTMSLRKTK